MYRSRATRYGVAAAVAAMALVGCGSSPTSSPSDTDAAPDAAAKSGEVYAKFAELSGADREEQLVEAAEAEGALNIYTSWTYMDALVEGFEEKYDLSVSVYRASSETVLQRVLQEQQAGFYGNDVLETNQLEMAAAQDEGLFGEYSSELRDRTREEAQFDQWTATRFNAFVVQWNTEHVKPGEEPKSFEELAGEAWAGRLSMEVGDAAWMQALSYYYLDQGKTQEEVDALFVGLAENSEVTKGHTAWNELMAAGQFEVAMSQYLQVVEKSKEKGQPVEWRPAEGKPVEPIVLQANGMAVMKNAEHPAAATLFLDYALSDEGQAIIVKEVKIGALPGENDPLEGLEVIPLPEDKLLSEGKEWEERYDELLSSKPVS